jgi:hypothetical protein
MEEQTKKILGAVLVFGTIGGGFYLFKRGSKLLSGAKMNFALVGFRIHKMTLTDVQFVVKLRTYNPTPSPITLAVNQVVANYKGSPIAFSVPDIKGKQIDAGKIVDHEITFQAPYLSLIGKGITTALLQNTEQLKADLSFALTLSINGETIKTCLRDEVRQATQNLSKENMNGIGQLGIVSGPRKTIDGQQYNHLIKRADGKSKLIKTGNVLETVESCVDIVANHYLEVEDLANTLRADTLKNTCNNIFDFAYNYLQYKLDDAGTEQLRTPARSWMDGQIKYKQQGDSDSGIDCDDYSIFVGSILRNLDIPFKFRITKYDGKSNFQHIYVFVPAIGDSEDEIIIDPVLSKFDYQKPYSFQRSDFNMSPLKMAAGVKGIDGLSGSTGLGLPIYALSGVNSNDNNHTELMSIVSGVDFDNTIDGLGSAEDATLNYLIRTRNFLMKSKTNKNKIAHIQNPEQFISMLNQAIKFWHTPQREQVLEKLANIEEKLASKGFIKYDDNEVKGLGRCCSRFFGSIKKIGQRVGKGIKKAGKKIGSVAKKVLKAVVRYNPLSIAIRGGLLAALRLNMFGISKKLQYAYLPDSLAEKHGINSNKLKDLKKRHHRVVKLFRGLQGREKNLRSAILKGAKQKNSDFSLSGTDGLLSELKRLDEIGELGNLGVVATAASIGAASGVLATIKKWLKPVGDLFKRVKKKVSKFIPILKKTANDVQRNGTRQAVEYKPQSVSTSSSSSNHSISTNMPRTPTSNIPLQKGISKGAKIGIGVVVAGLIGTGTYFILKEDDNKVSRKSQKKSLGSIALK